MYDRVFLRLDVFVSTQTRNLPGLEMAFPFPVMAPISSTVLLRIPLLEIFHLVRYPNWQSAITGTGRDSFVPFLVLGIPFPVLGYAISGTVIHWAPYRNWTLCTWSHFQYRALPVPVRSILGSRTRTELYARWVWPLMGWWVGGLVGLWLVCALFAFRGTMIRLLI